MYTFKVSKNEDIRFYQNREFTNFMTSNTCGRRLVLKGGRVVDPRNGIDEIRDLAIESGDIILNQKEIETEARDLIIDCENLLVLPGLIDIHVHLGDLFEVSTDSIFCAAQDGVTIGLSPGAGNTFMTPALLGAEIEWGLPLSLGVFLGAASVLSTRLSTAELIQMFCGKLSEDIMSEKMTRNGITNATAHLIIGIKDHMGHYIMSDENIDRLFEITSKAKLVYMSHTQDPEHSERMVNLSQGRPLHLGHVTAAGCGTHSDAVEGLSRVLNLIDGKNITGEFVTSMLRPSRGNREGIRITRKAQQIAFDALHEGKIKILVSDGQNQSTMKGFGDTRDNLPAIFELVELNVLSLTEAVSTMSVHPADFLAIRTGNSWWKEKIGHLGTGAVANVTIVDKNSRRSIYTIVNGVITAFESRIVRNGLGAGGWMSKYGMNKHMGVGDLPIFIHK